MYFTCLFLFFVLNLEAYCIFAHKIRIVEDGIINPKIV